MASYKAEAINSPQFGSRLAHDSPPLSPLSSSASSESSNSLDEGQEALPDSTNIMMNDAVDPELLNPEFQEAKRQALLWSAALRTKKAAMENMLQAQRSLEKVEESIAHYVSMETIEGTNAQFLSALRDSPSPEASYLLTLGRMVVLPLSSRFGPFRGIQSRPAHAHGSLPHVKLSRTLVPVATRG